MGRIVAFQLEEDRTRRKSDKATGVALEDLTVIGEDARLHLQIKLRGDGSKAWSPGLEAVKDFLARADGATSSVRFGMLSNAGFTAQLRARSSEYVTFSKVEQPNQVDRAGVATGDLRNALLQELAAVGVSAPGTLAPHLLDRLANLCTVRGGSRVDLVDLRQVVLDAIGASAGALYGGEFRPLRDALSSASGSDLFAFPTWTDLEAGAVLVNEDLLARLEECARRDALALIEGNSSQGKTSQLRALGHRLDGNGDVVGWHDVAREGLDPARVHRALDSLATAARVHRCEAWLLIDNVHRSPTGLRDALHAWERNGRVVRLVLCTRQMTDDLDGVHKALLDRTRVEARLDRFSASDLTSWWLGRRHGLDGDDLQAAMRSVPWKRYQADGWLLRLAIEAYDPAHRTLGDREVRRFIEGRILSVLRAHAHAGDVLYVVAGLFSHEVKTDLDAVSKMLMLAPTDVRAAADVLREHGLVARSDDGGSLSMHHRTLARLVWEAFGTHPRWGVRARTQEET